MTSAPIDDVPGIIEVERRPARMTLIRYTGSNADEVSARVGTDAWLNLNGVLAQAGWWVGTQDGEPFVMSDAARRAFTTIIKD